MMNDKQLIAKLQELKQIKPSKDWVVSLKKEIIGEQPKFGSPAYAKASVGRQILTIFEVLPKVLFQKKLAYAFAFCLVVLIGMFGFAQNTLPGDLLFPVKKIAEQSQGALLSGVEQSKYNLDIANRRLEDLANIIKTNRTGNITPAIQEVKETVNEIAKNMPSNPDDFTGIATRVQKIQQTKREVETLGVIMLQESETLNDALAPLVGNEIESLEKTTLNETQQQTLTEIKAHYTKGEYTAALEKILLITNLK